MDTSCIQGLPECLDQPAAFRRDGRPGTVEETVPALWKDMQLRMGYLLCQRLGVRVRDKRVATAVQDEGGAGYLGQPAIVQVAAAEEDAQAGFGEDAQ